jgi:hypothetical protein
MQLAAVLGDPLFSRDAEGKLKSRIATAFPHCNAIVTLPGIHAFQTNAFIDWLNQRFLAMGSPPMTRAEERVIRNDAVALIIEGDAGHETVNIRPDPENMPQAFTADALLQRMQVSKRQIKFLNVFNRKVRDAVKRHGDCWRIVALPTLPDEMKQRIAAAKAGIRGRELYYHNSTTGTRWLTYHEFSRLGDADPSQLRRHLAEIQEFSALHNSQYNPEIDFFMAGRAFGRAALAMLDFRTLDDAALHAVYENLRDRFQQAVPPEFRADDADDDRWRNRMFSALIAETDVVVQEDALLALSPEFHMQIQWLPGGRIVHGELLFDEVFEEDGGSADDPRASASAANNAREFLFNLVRTYDDLEYVNIGRVVNSLSRRSECRGRREVYIAVIKRHTHPEESVSIIRMQKWGVREHLGDGLPLLHAMFKSDEYTEYVLDRRFACHHLGMNIARHITTRKVCEWYAGNQAGQPQTMIWSPYFRREYIQGIATDKMPRARFQDPRFALQFARQLGLAAAPNIVVGRCDDVAQKVLFDDGDEVVIEDAWGMPAAIMVADQTGTFGDYLRPLQDSVAAYADPISRRIDDLANPEEFIRAYLDAFLEKFSAVQEKYRRRRRSFDTLFKNRPYSEEGTFAYRWERVLKRLDETDPRELVDLIQAQLPIGDVC